MPPFTIYECWSAHTLLKQKLLQIIFCQMAFKLNPEWIVVNCKPFNGLLCSRLPVLFLSEKRCVTSRKTAAKETSPSIAAPMFRSFLPQGDLYLQHSLSQRSLCRHSSKIVHHRDALGWKKWNMKIRFCRRILDISGQWLFRQPARTQHQERHKFAYRTMRKFCTLCTCFFLFSSSSQRFWFFPQREMTHFTKWILKKRNLFFRNLLLELAYVLPTSPPTVCLTRKENSSLTQVERRLKLQKIIPYVKNQILVTLLLDEVLGQTDFVVEGLVW